MRDNEPDPVDALIDDTARAMTAAAPPVSLRAEVRQRIERPARIPWKWRAGLAAASIVLVAFIAGRAWLSAPSKPDLPRATMEETVATAAPVAAADVAPAPVPAPPRTAVVRPAAAKPLPLPQPIVVQPIVLEPLSETMPVELELLETPMPLRAEWVEIERLVFE